MFGWDSFESQMTLTPPQFWSTPESQKIPP
ncbi:hypothetical protein CBM2594_P220007 [Cupriavidus taiwanensis]|uniref:Uncharacterized protein n=1 Tax=Cupriavidus taiwanensis TaxID=164546 RepID=A0A7Z7JES7_9BURK|nr:hypothetical protein CBM2594_P220007 [Cupriavidus taiwanensis]